MPASRDRNRGGGPAFSLIELLVVITVVAILITLVSFGFGSVAALSTTGAISDVKALLDEAREEALVSNQAVQVRIYESTSDLSPNDMRYRRFVAGRVIAIEDPADPDYGNPAAYDFRPLGEVVELPESVEVQLGGSHSTLVEGYTPGSAGDILQGSTVLPGQNAAGNYSIITFTPKLEAALDPDKEWTLTLIRRGSEMGPGGLPANYAILRLIPQSGRVLLSRP